MTHHMIEPIGRDWLSQMRNVFLIRDPQAVLASYVVKRVEVTLNYIGVVQQHELLSRKPIDWVTHHPSSKARIS